VGEFWNNAVRFVRRGWGIKKRVKHPLTIAGMILGVITLILIISTYSSEIVFGFITGYFESFIALTILIFVLTGLNLRRNAIAPS